jgi:hypothetical protein
LSPVRLAAAASVLFLLTACGREGPPPEQTGVVDSAVPIAVLLDRFREGVDDPGMLTGGASSRDALVRAFVQATERADSSAFADLAISRAEFAWLYYPVLPEAGPPYELDPRLMWFMIETNSRRGLHALLQERGGRPLGYVDYSCEGERTYDGVTLWGPCLVRRIQAPGDTVTERMFGPIVARDGRFKFVSFANKL